VLLKKVDNFWKHHYFLIDINLDTSMEFEIVKNLENIGDLVEELLMEFDKIEVR
jgi:hypothetical protein